MVRKKEWRWSQISSWPGYFLFLLKKLRGFVVLAPQAVELSGHFLLPVHKRLGTQFKMYFEVIGNAKDEANDVGFDVGIREPSPSAPQASDIFMVAHENSFCDLDKASDTKAVSSARQIAERLASHYKIPTETISRHQKRRRTMRGTKNETYYHIWFCLESYPVVETLDELPNNMVFPI